MNVYNKTDHKCHVNKIYTLTFTTCNLSNIFIFGQIYELKREKVKLNRSFYSMYVGLSWPKFPNPVTSLKNNSPLNKLKT